MIRKYSIFPYHSSMTIYIKKVLKIHKGNYNPHRYNYQDTDDVITLILLYTVPGLIPLILSK